jgi:ABC-type sugar transport system substrate-binding protein
LPKQKGSPYFTSCDKGAEDAAKELGNVNLVYDGPEDGKAEDAANMIDQWSLKGTDVIAVSAVDPDVEGPAMKKAQTAGAKVITWDADTTGHTDARSFFVNQATAQEIGYALVDAMAKDLGGDKATGDVAVITGDLTAANQNEWRKYMEERLKKYPGLRLVATKPAKEDPKLSQDVAQDLMRAYPTLKGIFAITSVAFPAAADAVEQAGKAGQVLVTGLGLPSDMVAHVKKGSVKSVILWNTQDLGYLTVYVARALADGTLKPGDTTIKAGRLGTLKVVGDNVMLGGITVFNKDNIDKYIKDNPEK